MMSSCSPEELFNVLSHIKLFTLYENSYLKDNFRIFFCRSNEKNYNAKLRIEILVNLSCEKNVDEMIEELCEYSSSRN